MMPALLTSTSRRPNSPTAVPTSVSAPLSRDTSLLSAIATPPASLISATTDDAGSASAPSPSMDPPRSLTTTRAPRSARRRACARPIPRPAPVTTATRPSKLCSRTLQPFKTVCTDQSVYFCGSHHDFGSCLRRGSFDVQKAVSGEARRSEKWNARRDVIVDTSAQVFARGGYHATGIVELCAANGLAKGAFYHYIESKEDLLAAIHDRVMDEVMLGADRVAAAGGTPSEQLAMLGKELLDVIHRYPDHVWVFLHEFPALTAERADQFRRRRRAYERRVQGVLQAGIDAGEFRKVDAKLTALAWL